MVCGDNNFIILGICLNKCKEWDICKIVFVFYRLGLFLNSWKLFSCELGWIDIIRSSWLNNYVFVILNIFDIIIYVC